MTQRSTVRVVAMLSILVMASTMAVVLSGLTTSSTVVAAADPRPLSRNQAKQLLTVMGCEDVEIGAIVHGLLPIDFGMAGCQNAATVYAIGRQYGHTQKMEVEFLFDADIGWFKMHYGTIGVLGTGKKERVTSLWMWTTTGVKELWPQRSLTDSSIAELLLGRWETEDGAQKVSYTKDGQWTHTVRGKTSSGSWKIERGVLIADPALTGESPIRWELLSLDKSLLVLHCKVEDGAVYRHELRRIDEK